MPRYIFVNSASNKANSVISFSKKHLVMLLVAAVLIWMFYPMIKHCYKTEENMTDTKVSDKKLQNVDNTVPNVPLIPGQIIPPNPVFPTGYTDPVLNGQEPIGVETTDNNSNLYMLDDGADGRMSITNNLYSKACCSPQYPPPFATPYDETACKTRQEYANTNYYGNNSFQDSGCLCMTKDQYKFINSRGGNS